MRLASFILANVKPIMVEWEAYARSIWPTEDAAQTTSAAEVRDHAVQILRAVAADMKTAQTAREAFEKSKGHEHFEKSGSVMDAIAVTHGEARQESGFALWAVLAEYRALRASVVRLWQKNNPSPAPQDVDDLTRFNESIDQSLAGAVEGFSCEAERSRAALAESEENFRTLAESLPQLAWAAHADGSIYWYNQRWYDFTGKTAAEVLGWGWQSVHDPAVLPKVLARWEQSILSGEHFEMTFPLRGQDGVFRKFLTRVVPLLNAAGGIVRWFGTSTDVTEQQRLADELHGYRVELEKRVEERTRDLEKSQAAMRQKERLAAMGTLAAGLGHDLANLMMPLTMRLDSLSREALTQSGRQDVEGIAGSLTYLRSLLAGLRQMSADPAAAPPPTGIEIAEWWAEAAPMLKGVLPHHVHLTSAVSLGLPRVRVSKGGLTQAVFNLVQNAGEVLASAPTGTVRVVVALAPLGDLGDSCGVVLSVADDGPGMTPEVAARCFEPYFSTKGRAVSTGMGLALVRGVADQAGGSVAVTSAPGLGTVFTLHLPPISQAANADAERAGNHGAAINALVDVRDPRVRALLGVLMEPLQIVGRKGEFAAPGDAALWITDSRPEADLDAFLRAPSDRGHPDASWERFVMLLGEPPRSGAGQPEGSFNHQIVYVGHSPKLAAARDTLKTLSNLIRRPTRSAL